MSLKIKTSITIVLLSIVSLFLISWIYPTKDDASEIIKKADEKRLGKTSFSEMNLKILRPKWSRDIGLKVWTKENDFIMILVTSPARDKGTAFLKRKNEIYNWIPRIERSIKLPPSSMMQGWMGSDFTNDDLVKQSSMVKDYDHKLIGKETLNGREVFKILLEPKEGASVVWGKIEAWVDTSEFLFLKLEYYDEEGELINTILGKNVKNMGGRTITSTLEITPTNKPENKTILEYNSIEFDKPIDDTFFSLRNLKNIK